MSKVVLEINGGIGRVLCAEPAVSYFSNHRSKDVVIVTSWPDVFTNNPNINKVYHLNAANLFEDSVRGSASYYAPEPYHDAGYYNQERHLIESFDFLINGKEAFTKPSIYLTDEEKHIAMNILSPVLGSKLIAFQPFGSSASRTNWAIIDDSYRSLPSDAALMLVDLMPDFMFINFSHIKCDRPNVFNLDVNLRQYLALVSACNYVISVDSLLSHVGYAFNKPGINLLGSTFEKNIGYSNHYKTITKDGYPKSYNPNRIGGYAEKNQMAMHYSEEQIYDIIQTTKDFFDCGLCEIKCEVKCGE